MMVRFLVLVVVLGLAAGRGLGAAGQRVRVSADLVVYGGTPAGVMAAVEAGRQGRTVLLLEPTRHVGGILANGLGYTDLYQEKALSGLGVEFFKRVAAEYAGDAANLKISNRGRIFEPHVAERVFGAMLAEQTTVRVVLGAELRSVKTKRKRIRELETWDGARYAGAVFVDASYTGDLMAAAGVRSVIGREPAAEYGEKFGGAGKSAAMGKVPVSAYKVPGDAGSGLLAHVSGEPVEAAGSGDRTVMAYNYRVCLSDDAAKRVPVEKPEGYDAAEYELLGRLAEADPKGFTVRRYLDMHALPNHKYDWNNSKGLFSTDEVGASDEYPEGSRERRKAIEAEQKRYLLGWFYFLMTDKRIPAVVQARAKELGLCGDEFADNGGWPWQIYVREARRMVGAYVMTAKDLTVKDGASGTAVDSIAMGGYPVDDHLHHIWSRKGVVEVEATDEEFPKPYAIPYRVLTPKAEEATNLLVPVCVSASHVAYDSLRVEVTYMAMGQAAGAAAALAVTGKSAVQNVDVGALQKRLVEEGVVVGSRE